MGVHVQLVVLGCAAAAAQFFTTIELSNDDLCIGCHASVLELDRKLQKKKRSLQLLYELTADLCDKSQFKTYGFYFPGVAKACKRVVGEWEEEEEEMLIKGFRPGELSLELREAVCQRTCRSTKVNLVPNEKGGLSHSDIRKPLKKLKKKAAVTESPVDSKNEL
mmetsp:Transcript_72925/g.121744  ORF Transcript_72925/g.121744 Transcript_72925/m.121744 type:complete len:164 (-) Transcript_72925:275-766(-)|eukprot:CAMPEP_0119321110 /NCGR_PEP_ID=MMETSP1333-20130426/54446_1 /TAXON_ID=418940 /ORGANISM="Scyphosphaera apsteinii, Strain RCC1455" /LENGTH=163 /DNA_ID=CAMNT_0007327997 /DNA_START=255 /DNA_END=746 /DNA_ORIENTATION=+